MGQVFRQIRDEVREVVDVQTFGGCHDFMAGHGLDQAGTDFLVELDEDFALAVVGNRGPYRLPLVGPATTR